MLMLLMIKLLMLVLDQLKSGELLQVQDISTEMDSVTPGTDLLVLIPMLKLVLLWLF